MPNTCTAPECTKPVRTDGRCIGHYNAYLYGQLTDDPAKQCVVEDCRTVRYGRKEYCVKHHSRWKRTGDPSTARPKAEKYDGQKCAHEDCASGAIRKGLCNKHYMQLPEQRARKAEWYQANKDRITENASTWAEENPGKKKEAAKKYSLSVKGKETRKRYAEENKDVTRQWHKKNYQDNKEQITERVKQYQQENVDRVKAAHQAYYERNDEKIKANAKAWRLAHPEERAAAQDIRRSRGSCTLDKVDREIAVAYRKAIRNDPCFYCGAKGEHVDHYIPLALGGTNHWWNLVRSCGPCNMRKHTMHGDEFLALIA